jgi:inorganic pyrophosphatase
MRNTSSLKLARGYIGKTVAVTVDRPFGSKHPKHGFVYEVNYGFVEGVIAPDGECLDAYILGLDQPVDSFSGICIAVVHREDDDDDKLVVVPDGLGLTDREILEVIDFQEKWFKSSIVRV